MKALPILALILLAACTTKPAVMLVDGTKVWLGGSVAAKSTSEADSATITTPSGVKIMLKHMSAGKDETAVPNAYIGYKAAVGLGGQAAHSANVSQQQQTAREANARVGTVTTSTGPSGGTIQTVTAPPAAVVPSIGH